MVRRQGRASTPSETAKYHPEYKTHICIDWEDGDCPRQGMHIRAWPDPATPLRPRCAPLPGFHAHSIGDTIFFSLDWF